jgi:adsorption protein B
VQLPVAPLVHPASRFVSGHYLDEFAEAHGKVMLVRQALGAGLPFAGVGCAIGRDMLAAIAAARGGAPFDEGSLTEDYELGLTIAEMGGRAAFVRVRERPGGALVAVRAYFPAELGAAVRQKARWMTGIALAGWDRVGWGRARDLSEHWMRMRDRRAIVAMPVLATAYFALVAWGLSLAGHALAGAPTPWPSALTQLLVSVNLALFGWRLLVRAAFVGADHGWREALLSAPRLIVANYVSLLAARRAAFAYLKMLRGNAPHWDKTAHEFPADTGHPA